MKSYEQEIEKLREKKKKEEIEIKKNKYVTKIITNETKLNFFFFFALFLGNKII